MFASGGICFSRQQSFVEEGQAMKGLNVFRIADGKIAEHRDPATKPVPKPAAN
jgi:predicted SnoaL-like aldol condensation-catalyzing enzyme